MKTAAALKWHTDSVVNREETMLGADIVWRKISDEKGRGVFAARAIRKGEIIEVAPGRDCRQG